MTKTAPLPLTWTNDRVTVRLFISDGGTIVVETYQGSYRLNGWCRAYPTKTQGRRAARYTAKAFRAHGTDIGIERRRAELVRIITEQQGRARRGMHDRDALEAAEAEYHTLLSLADLAALDDMRAWCAD